MRHILRITEEEKRGTYLISWLSKVDENISFLLNTCTIKVYIIVTELNPYYINITEYQVYIDNFYVWKRITDDEKAANLIKDTVIKIWGKGNVELLYDSYHLH